MYRCGSCSWATYHNNWCIIADGSIRIQWFISKTSISIVIWCLPIFRYYEPCRCTIGSTNYSFFHTGKIFSWRVIYRIGNYITFHWKFFKHSFFTLSLYFIYENEIQLSPQHFSGWHSTNAFLHTYTDYMPNYHLRCEIFQTNCSSFSIYFDAFRPIQTNMS